MEVGKINSGMNIIQSNKILTDVLKQALAKQTDIAIKATKIATQASVEASKTAVKQSVIDMFV